MKMGEGGAFVAGGLLGGALTLGPAYQAGYNQRDAELQPHIRSLQNQLIDKDRQIAELQKALETKAATSIPLISKIRKKLRVSQSLESVSLSFSYRAVSAVPRVM